MWKPNQEKPPRCSSSGMRNICHLAICDLNADCFEVFHFSSYSFLLSCSLFLLFFLLLLLIRTQPGSTLLLYYLRTRLQINFYKIVCALSCRSAAQQPTTIRLLSDLNLVATNTNWLNLTISLKLTLIQNELLLFIVFTRPCRVDWVQIGYYRLK